MIKLHKYVLKYILQKCARDRMRLELGCLCKAEITGVKNLFGRE